MPFHIEPLELELYWASDRPATGKAALARQRAGYDAQAERLAGRFEGDEQERIRRAYRLAQAGHEGQKRSQGAPYISHPLGVARILVSELGVSDADVVAAALLHDVIEDTPTTAEQVEEQTGPRVRALVEALTKKPGGEGYFEELRQAPPEAALIKAADRIHNLRSPVRHDWTPARVQGYADQSRAQILPLVASNPQASGALEATLAGYERRIAHEGVRRKAAYEVGGHDRYEVEAERNEAAIFRAAAGGAGPLPSLGVTQDAGALQPRRAVARLKADDGATAELARELGLERVIVELSSVRVTGSGADGGTPPMVFAQAVRASRGEPLDAGVAGNLGRMFQRSLPPDVRVHTGPYAGYAAGAIGAEAFTIGRDIFMGAGRWQPETPEGLALLGHELTHVFQAGAGGAGGVRRSASAGLPSALLRRSAGGTAARAKMPAPVRRSAIGGSGAGFGGAGFGGPGFDGATLGGRGGAPIRRSASPMARASGPIRRSALHGAFGGPAPGGAPASGGGGGKPGTVLIGTLRFRFGGAPSGPSTDGVALKRVARASGGEGGQAPASFGAAVARSPGAALSAPLRASMEGMLGANFSGVRIHNDPMAYAAADQIAAEAFTIGQDVFFGFGRFDPRSNRGQALIGHELTHVRQHLERRDAGFGGGSGGGSGGGLWIAGHDRLEREAEAFERALLGGGGGDWGAAGSASGSSAAGGAVRRKASPGGTGGAGLGGGASVRASSSAGAVGGAGADARGLAGRLQRKVLGAGSLAGNVLRSAAGTVRRSGGVLKKLFGVGSTVKVSEPGPGSIVIGQLSLRWAGGGAGVVRRKAGPSEMALAHQVRASGGDAGAAPAGFLGPLGASSGTELPTPILARMEGLFGMDLSGVRVHTDPFAQEAASMVGAEAFTLGEDIYFNTGRFAPNSAHGLALLAHELTHVAQGRGAAPTFDAARGGTFGGDGRERLHPGGGVIVGGQDLLERQAEANERAVLHAMTGGGALGVAATGATVRSGYPGALARKAEEAAGEAGLCGPLVSPDDGEVGDAVQIFRQIGSTVGTIADIGIGFVPVVGQVYDVLCGLIGRAIFGWRELDVWERLLYFAGVLPIPFISGGILSRGKRALSWAISERRAARILADLTGRAVEFVKRNVGRLRSWVSTSRMVQRAGEGITTAAAVPARVLSIVGDTYRGWRANKHGGSEAVRVLEDGVRRLEALMRRHNLNNTTQAAYYEFRALRMQGYSASEAHGLMKRFRGGEAVDGFAFHFANPIGGQGITTSGKVRAGQGYLGRGVYAGSTPTPSALQQRTPIAGWGLDEVRDVRIPIRMGPGKEAHSAVLPTKTYMFEVTQDMPLAGGIADIARNDGLLTKLYYRYRTLAMAAAGLFGVGQLLSQFLFKDKRPGAGAQAAALADRLGRRGMRAQPSGRGADPGAWLEEWGSLEPRERDRLTRVAEHARELDAPGLPLEWAVRSRLEAALGQDLSSVRVHTGLRAERLAADMEAHAFAFGQRIVMGAGSYEPDTVEGLGTLVHEATHTLQDRRGQLSGHASAGRTDALEREAYAREHAFVAGAQARGHGYRLSSPDPIVRDAPPVRVDVEDLPATAPRAAVPGSLSGALKKAVDDPPRNGKADGIERIMEEWRGAGASREDFLEELKERLLDLMHDELEVENERRETLAWNNFLPLA